jgi:hypothetical protein
MKSIIVAAGLVLTATAAPGFAQGDGATPCYIEVPKLMAEPPDGIAELGAALRQLDTQLRPQVEAINQLKAQIARLEQRQAPTGPDRADTGSEEEEAPRPAPVPLASDPTAAELQRVQAELDAKQAQLKLDYAAHRAAIVGPVQTRVSQGAQAYGTEQGCREIKMARTPDLAALTTAGARDLTAGFVTWYAVNHPAAAVQ